MRKKARRLRKRMACLLQGHIYRWEIDETLPRPNDCVRCNKKDLDWR